LQVFKEVPYCATIVRVGVWPCILEFWQFSRGKHLSFFGAQQNQEKRLINLAIGRAEEGAEQHQRQADQ
jgi:hypothetical protein